MLNNFFSNGNKNENLDNIMRITKIIRPLIDKTARQVVKSHTVKLFTEAIDYIVPAVWGAKKEGELESTQIKINRQIVPFIKELLEVLELKDLNSAQEFAIGFLIREMIISKITFLIEMGKNQAFIKMNPMEKNTHFIDHLETVGNA